MEKLSLTGISHKTPDEFATLSAVVMTPDQVFIDNGAIHGKSRVEKGIQFIAKTPEEVKGGMEVYIIWVTLQKSEAGSGYNGITASRLVIHQEVAAGYKSLPDQVNKMSDAMKGKIDVSVLPETDKKRLGNFLKEFRNGELWQHAQAEIREILG